MLKTGRNSVGLFFKNSPTITFQYDIVKGFRLKGNQYIEGSQCDANDKVTVVYDAPNYTVSFYRNGKFIAANKYQEKHALEEIPYPYILLHKEKTVLKFD